MLKHLSITNYAIIENVEIEFNSGFTVITGETGAGKSILLGALGLVLGQRADLSILSNKEKKCIIEAEFKLDKAKYSEFLESNDFDYEEYTIIRREITSSGKSRAFINDTPVSLVFLKELTAQLIDIHSQYQTLQVENTNFQIGIVDSFANLDELLILYRSKYKNYLKSKLEFKNLEELSSKAESDTDYISFQAKEIAELDLKPNEKEDIVAQLEIINNSEEIKSVLDNAENRLIDSENNILLELKDLTTSFSKISSRSEDYAAICERLNSLFIELEDVVREIGFKNNDLSFDPENSAFLNDRLSSIYSIEQKHNLSSSAEILSFLEQLNRQLQDTHSYKEKLIELSDELEEMKKDLKVLSKEISNRRKASFSDLINKLVDGLNLLGMPNASIEIRHQLLEDLNENGLDSIAFLFSSNKGVQPSQLGKVASGGELSRLMLIIKSILANNRKLSSIIFDEIDAGVSGDISDKMADVMKEMSLNIQVLSITHLPQVAAKGETHYKIYKETTKEDRTLTSVALLNSDERVEELAKMLSGKELSNAAKENAKTLLNV